MFILGLSGVDNPNNQRVKRTTTPLTFVNSKCVFISFPIITDISVNISASSTIDFSNSSKSLCRDSICRVCSSSKSKPAKIWTSLSKFHPMVYNKCLDRAKLKGTFDFFQTRSKHRQVISSKFPKSFRGVRDLVVFYELFNDFWGSFGTFKNSPSTTKSRAPLKLFGSLLEITWRQADGVLIKLWEKSKVPLLYGPTPVYNKS